MPVDLFFEDPSLFVLRASGIVTYDEVRRTIDGLLADARLQPGVSILIDNRQVTRTPSIGEVAAITRHFAKVFARGARRVALVTDNEMVYRVSQVFASFASTVGSDTKVFREDETARKWLAEG